MSLVVPIHKLPDFKSFQLLEFLSCLLHVLSPVSLVTLPQCGWNTAFVPRSVWEGKADRDGYGQIHMWMCAYRDDPHDVIHLAIPSVFSVLSLCGP